MAGSSSSTRTCTMWRGKTPDITSRRTSTCSTCLLAWRPVAQPVRRWRFLHFSLRSFSRWSSPSDIGAKSTLPASFRRSSSSRSTKSVLLRLAIYQLDCHSDITKIFVLMQKKNLNAIFICSIFSGISAFYRSSSRICRSVFEKLAFCFSCGWLGR